MRAATLFRWGLSALMLAPLAFLAWFASPRSASDLPSDAPAAIVAVALGWGAIAPALGLTLILLGGLLNLLAIRRGVRGLDRFTTAETDLTAGSVTSARPRQRIIIPDDWEDQHPVDGSTRARPALTRRGLGAVLAAAVLALTAFGVWMLAVEFPLGMSDGLTLEQVRAAVGVAHGLIDDVTIIVWAALGVIGAALMAALGLLRHGGLDTVLRARRFIALAAIVGSALVVASTPVLFGIGITLADAVPPYRGGQSIGSWAFGHVGIALSAAAILLTVPRWGRSPARPAAPPVSPYF